MCILTWEWHSVWICLDQSFSVYGFQGNLAHLFYLWVEVPFESFIQIGQISRLHRLDKLLPFMSNLNEKVFKSNSLCLALSVSSFVTWYPKAYSEMLEIHEIEDNQPVNFDTKNISRGCVVRCWKNECSAQVFSTPYDASEWDIFHIKNNQLIILFIIYLINLIIFNFSYL